MALSTTHKSHMIKTLDTIPEERRNWHRDWEWACECLPYRIAFVSYHWRTRLDEIDQHDLLAVMSTHDYGSIHMKRFKYAVKQEFLKRFVEEDYPHLL